MIFDDYKSTDSNELISKRIVTAPISLIQTVMEKPYYKSTEQTFPIYTSVISRVRKIEVKLVSTLMILYILASGIFICIVISCSFGCINATSARQLKPLRNVNSKMKEIMKNDFQGELDMEGEVCDEIMNLYNVFNKLL